MAEKICGHSWEAIQRAQRGGHLSETIKFEPGKEYGADPIGDGTFRMVPSGDIVGWEERCRRLGDAV